jgi:hypothetical protein
MGKMGRPPAKAFGTMAILGWTMILPIHHGTMGFYVPAIMVGSGNGLVRKHGHDGWFGSSPLLQRALALRSASNAPFGHPNDEMREIYFANPQDNTRYNRDDEAISARQFVFPDVAYGRAFAVQGGQDSSADNSRVSSEPAITDYETPVLQDPNDSLLLASHVAYPDSTPEDEAGPAVHGESAADMATAPTVPSHVAYYQVDIQEGEQAGSVVQEESSSDSVATPISVARFVNQDVMNETKGPGIQQVAPTIDAAAAPMLANHQASPELKIAKDARSVVTAASTIATTSVSESRQDVVANPGSIAAIPSDSVAAEPVVTDQDVDLATVEEIRPPAFAMPEACPPSIAMPEIPASIKQTLRSPAWKAPLALIASAYHPGLLVENIREISVGTVDDTHLDVEALVCKGDAADDCVTVKVPVDFPTSCFGAEDASKCILDNIQQLSDLIKAEGESGLFPTEKTLLERERLLKEVVSPRFLEYPTWWETPVVLAGACNTLRSVLNDAECQPQLQRLFRKNSSKAQRLVRAALVAVGPCGVIMRALDTKNQLHEVPIAFAVPATDAGRLRSAVLELFG